MKFVHTADIHLDSPLRGLERYDGAPVAEIRGATRRALENLVQLCLDEQAQLLLIAGDLYDGDWKDYNTGLFFVQQMARLTRSGIRVVMIRGNHDAASQLSRTLRLPEGVYDLSTRKAETRIFDDLGIAVHGRGYGQRDVEENIAAHYPQALDDYFNIGLLHTALDGRAGHAPYAPCRIDDLLAKGYDYWALGHVHQHEIVQREPWIVFPGNPQGRHIRESGARGAMLVTLEDGAVDDVEHRALDVLRWHTCRVDIACAQNPDEMLNLVLDRLQDAAGQAGERLLAVRLQLTGASPVHGALVDDFGHWQQQLRALAQELGDTIWLEKIELQTRSPIAAGHLLGGDDAIGALLRSLQALPGDDAELGRLLAEFETLKAKLPPEYRQQEEALDLDDPRTLCRLLNDLDQWLLPRLLEREDG